METQKGAIPMDITSIIAAYTAGEKTLEETNEALRAIDSNLQLVPGKNELTAEEVAATSVGLTPADANGYGLLDMGLGSMEKVKVSDGTLVHAINQVNEDGTTNMLVYCLIGGKRYEVKGDKLVNIA